MKGIIKISLLILALSLNLLAQESQISQSPSSIEVTNDEVSAVKTKNVMILGSWDDRTLQKNTDRTFNFHSQDGWISLSPPIPGEKLNDVHTFNETTAIIIGNGGVVYKTTDRGSNWTKISSGTTSALNALFFLDDNNGWIVGGSGKILKTVDGGDSWRVINTNLYTLYDVFFTNIDTGYTITSKSIYMTTDSGENWVEKFKSSEATYFFESIAFCNANTGIAVGCLSKMYRTTDAGETWTLITSGNAVWKYDVKFVDASHGWIAGLQASRIYIEVGWLGTTIQIDNPQYALWKTSDGGATWTQLNFAYSGRLYDVYFHDPAIGWTVGTNGAVFRTEDGGTTWSATKSVHDMYAVHFCNAQSGWTVGDDGTILYSNNSGNLWVLQSGNGTTSSLYTVHFVDSLTGWAAGAGGKMLRTTNGGGLWFEQDVNTSYALESVFFINNQKGYTAFGSYPYMRYTTDGGVSWSAVSPPSPSFLLGLNCVFFVDDQSGWVAGKNGDIMHTSNGGTSWSNWSRQTSGTTEELNSIHFVDPLSGWAVGNKGTIIHTQDGGSTWSPQASGLNSNLQSVHFADNMHGFIVGPIGMMLRTTDGGKNWGIMRIGDNAVIDVYFADVQTGWAVGTGGTILKTTDGGNTWGLQMSGTTQSLQSVHFVDTQTGYIVGSGGTILKTTNGGGNVLYPPTLASPSDGSTDISISPTLSWNACSGAISYRLQVLTSSTFSTSQIVIDQSGITGTSYQITGLADVTKYYWRVNTLYAEGSSNWSNIWSFITIDVPPPPAPRLEDPSDGATNQLTNLLFVWFDTPGALSYRLQLATDSIFTTTVWDYETVHPYKPVRTLAINTTYYWRVSVENSHGISPWSGVWRFTTISDAPSAPILSSPSNGAMDQLTTLTLRWNSAPGASNFRLQVATDSIFTIAVFDDSSLTSAYRQVGPLAINTTYYWRVSAKNVFGSSPWSSVRRFTTISGAPSAPTLSSPSNGAVDQLTTLTLRWNSTPSASNYYLLVASDSIFATVVFNDSSITSTSRSIGPLAANTTYYWRVKAKNVLGSSPWSTVWRFTTISGAPSAPILVSPTNGTAQLSIVTLHWNVTAGAMSFHLQVATDSIFNAPVFVDSSSVYNLRQVGPFANNITYYWRVRAKNILGISSWSSIWRFLVIAESPRQVTLLSPLDYEIIVADSTCFFWRQSVPVVDYYWFELATDSLMENPVIDSTLTTSDTTKIVHQLLDKQTYWWRVKAKNVVGWGPFSVQRRFRIDLSTGVQTNGDVPCEYSLSQNYPNPFNPTTTIKYQLPMDCHVTLKVFNALGQEVATLVNDARKIGYYSVSWDAMGQASGVYFVVLKAEDYTSTCKMLLIR